MSGGGTPSKSNPDYWNGDIPWISPKGFRSRTITDSIDHIFAKALNESSSKLIPADSVIMVVRSGILRHSIPVATNNCPVALNQDVKALIPGRDLDPRYLVSLIDGCQKSLLSEWSKRGATVESIEHEDLANAVLPLPPLDEQAAILKYLAHVDRNRIGNEFCDTRDA
jgi:type I restriction enzyme S subunit